MGYIREQVNISSSKFVLEAGKIGKLKLSKTPALPRDVPGLQRSLSIKSGPRKKQMHVVSEGWKQVR